MFDVKGFGSFHTRAIGERSRYYDAIRLARGNTYVSLLGGPHARFTHFVPVYTLDDDSKLKEMKLPIVCTGESCDFCALTRLEEELMKQEGMSEPRSAFRYGKSYVWVALDREGEMKDSPPETVEPQLLEVNATVNKLLINLVHEEDAPWVAVEKTARDWIIKISKTELPKAEQTGWKIYSYGVIAVQEHSIEEEIALIEEFAKKNSFLNKAGSMDLEAMLKDYCKAPEDPLIGFKQGRYVVNLDHSQVSKFGTELSGQLELLGVSWDPDVLKKAPNKAQLAGEVSDEKPSAGGTFKDFSVDEADEDLPFE